MNQTASRVILIGGTSNVGKSTLAQALSAKLGWQHISTDSLARHPGRPWGVVKPHVAEHYGSLSPDELIADVLRHYAGMWPGISELIASRLRDESAPRLVLEGSALWPESVATLDRGGVATLDGAGMATLDRAGVATLDGAEMATLDRAGVAALWLTAGDDFLRRRIHHTSGYAAAPEPARMLIDKFIARTQLYNQRMLQAIERLALPCIDVEKTSSLDELSQAALDRLGIVASSA